MIRFSAVTLFPEMFGPLTQEGVFSRGVQKGLLALDTVPLRNFSVGERRDVDDAPTGGGDGMVLMPEVCQNAVDSVRSEGSWVVVLSPSGKVFSHSRAVDLAKKKHLILMCGRYAGFDRRFEEESADEILSIGDFVLSGGELPALCVIDAVARQIPGVLGNNESAAEDSHSKSLLEAAQYTKPHVWRGRSVPQELLSGNHSLVQKMRRWDALRTTALRRPDLIDLVWDDLSRAERAFVTKVQKQG